MRIDESFDHPGTSVSVVAVEDGGEALPVRAILESLGAAVTLHLIGTPEDFLRVVGQGAAAPRYMVICGHGDENGLVFGEYGDGVVVSVLDNGSMPPDVIANRANLPDKVVVSTACKTGARPFGRAFLNGGATAYIAPDGYPDGADVGLFVHLLFHQILRQHVSPSVALRNVQRCDSGFGMFVLFEGS